uniref:Uncharacterized protein n=1 Tax=Boodleopsis sp. FL1161 TaxID=2364084 RepID=A0A386AZB0_9CHLO|nr:hypothetical protein Ycf47 [Boodleopsis sp. FL1161]
MWFFFSFRVLTNILIILFLEPQMVLWNPLITRLRNLFLTYEIAKKSIAKITWLDICIFYIVHF